MPFGFALVSPTFFSDDDFNRWEGPFVVFLFVLIALMSVGGLLLQRATDWIERRLERPRDRPLVFRAPNDLGAALGERTGGAGKPAPSESRSFSGTDETGAVRAGRGQGRPESFTVHSPWRFGLVVAWVGAVVVAAGAASEMVTVTANPLWVRVPVAVFAVVTGVALSGALRRGVGADAEGVTVVNFRRSYRLPWEELREVSFHLRSREPDEYSLEFLLRSGGSVIAAKPTDYRFADGGLRALRDRIHAAGEAALPGQVTSREPMQGKAQVVHLDTNRLESADVEIVNRPGFGGRSDSTERWSYASTKEVPR